MGQVQATDSDTSLGSNALSHASIFESFASNDSLWSWDASSLCDSPLVSTSTTASPSFDGWAWLQNEAYFLPEVLWPPNDALGGCSGPSLRRGSGDYSFQPPSRSVNLSGLEGQAVFPDRDETVVFHSPILRSSTPRQFQCDWPRCVKAGSFSSVEAWKNHIKEHARSVRNSWKPLEPCCWYGCPSKARHKTSKLFEDHLNNIHINPLICTVEGCKHKKPFRGKADLQRHISSVHIDGVKSRCPFPRCMSEGRDFSRKDKLISHLREIHDTDPCPFSHCIGGLNPMIDSTAKHIGKLHGEFECGLRSCRRSLSQFCERGFLEHLQLDHNMRWELVLKTRDAAKSLGSGTIRDEHIMSMEVEDCSVCCAFSQR
ncbi:hypothetical protein BDZ45DRAFT_105030 [Acephala macrosclerotiorum]|nr:hypothetical protein BDZ45DRAFT_105030 [Acephala macrosclerotiorum]